MQVKSESTPNPTLHTAQQRPKEPIQDIEALVKGW